MGLREYCCCTEVLEAGGKIAFEGRKDISCITQHEDYSAVTNSAVLEMVVPLLKDKDGRSYRQRAGQRRGQLVSQI